ncbi:Uncharacterised protein [Candidatus Tiddalikarchaeum anstoanum]|nr:Uncharacterised protein [Candidatus Tiddalikarchaeum anstoanum]
MSPTSLEKIMDFYNSRMDCLNTALSWFKEYNPGFIAVFKNDNKALTLVRCEDISEQLKKVLYRANRVLKSEHPIDAVDVVFNSESKKDNLSINMISFISSINNGFYYTDYITFPLNEPSIDLRIIRENSIASGLYIYLTSKCWNNSFKREKVKVDRFIRSRQFTF